jgi:hypothetical protein
MYSTETAGPVTAVDPIEALLLHKTTERNDKIAEWKLLSSLTVAPRRQKSVGLSPHMKLQSS